MSGRAWRRIAIGLGLLVAVLGWRSCTVGGKRGATRGGADAAMERADDERSGGGGRRGGRDARGGGAGPGGAAAAMAGYDGAEWSPEDDIEPPRPEPHWLVKFFTPRPGEDMLDYRDRVLPVVQAVVEPQRIRVAENWREFADSARLDDRQRAEMTAAVDQAVESLVDQAFQGVLSGEILPPNLKPSVGVAFARDLLDTVDGANRRFRAVLSPHQLEILDRSRFDIADYLVFATRWEDLLGVTQ